MVLGAHGRSRIPLKEGCDLNCLSFESKQRFKQKQSRMIPKHATSSISMLLVFLGVKLVVSKVGTPAEKWLNKMNELYSIHRLRDS